MKNKTYDDDHVENISYTRSDNFQRDRKSWPLAQVVECDALETTSNISPIENEYKTSCVNVIPSRNGCVTILQTDDVQLDRTKESCLDNPKNNVLKIVLPLVNENVPLHNHQLKTVEDEQFLQKENSVYQSNNHVQYISNNCVDTPLCITKNINNRNHSLPEDNELNRFSSTFENIKSLLKEGLVDGLDEKPPDFQPPNPPLLYRVSSLPNLLSHDSTKNHHSCSYLTMCATKHELIMNKLCKNIVAKHDMSVQVSTELFKSQNDKILVDTSCQTEDIFVNFQVNNEGLTKETNHNIFLTSSNVLNGEHKTNANEKNITNTKENFVSIGCTNIDDVSNKEHELEINGRNDINSINYTNINDLNKENDIKMNAKNDCASIDYTNINSFNKEQEIKTLAEKDCNASICYMNINNFNTDDIIKTTEEEDGNTSFEYSYVNNYNKEHLLNENVEDCTSGTYININVIDKEKVTTNSEDFCPNVSYTKITTFDKEGEVRFNNKECTNIDYLNMNVVDNGNVVNEEHCSKIDKELEVKNNGEDCVDIGYTNFNVYDKGLEIDSNDDCENYANANILEEFVNEQLSLNNADGDFDSFLFGPLPPSPIEEIGKNIELWLFSISSLCYLIKCL